MSKTNESSNIRILLADDHPVVREGIRASLGGQPHLEIVGEAADGSAIVSLVEEHKPDIVLMDINMPAVNGIEATRAIVAAGLPCRVIILTVVSSQEYMAEMMKAGAKGYVLKDAHPEELIEAIEEVHNGSLYYLVNEGGLGEINPPPPAKPPEDPSKVLSGREIQVLKLVANGNTSKDIALMFDVSVRTVKTYRERIMRKTGLHSVAEMTQYAVACGLLDSDDAFGPQDSVTLMNPLAPPTGKPGKK